MASIPPEPDLRSVEEVETALGLRPEDRGELPGLYVLNVVRVPVLRILGYQALLGFAALHNLVLGVGLPWGAFLAVALSVEAYAVLQLWALRTWFTEVRRVHLGTLFLGLDLVAFTVVIWATGGPASWLWPVYLVRVADQMWIGRGRAVAMAALALACYLGLLLLLGLSGTAVPWAPELLKVGILAAIAGQFVAGASLPWEFQNRARAAKGMILRLERQSLELEMERARAQEASRAKGEFLAHMSHELRTPLNSVVGFSKLLLKSADSGLDEKERNYAELIHKNSVHLLQVISDILDVARIQEGHMEIDSVPVDLEELVRDVVRELKERVQPGVRLFLSIPPGLGPLRADRGRLRQVLANLLDNALKYTPSGWVRLEVVPGGPDEAPAAIRVVDTGVGIEPGDLEAIFDPFEQVSGGFSRRYEGTGLGLAIARALCELMGFRLTVESEPGEGSTFSVHLGGAHEEGGRPDGPDTPLDADPDGISRPASRPA